MTAFHDWSQDTKFFGILFIVFPPNLGFIKNPYVCPWSENISTDKNVSLRVHNSRNFFYSVLVPTTCQRPWAVYCIYCCIIYLHEGNSCWLSVIRKCGKRAYQQMWMKSIIRWCIFGPTRSTAHPTYQLMVNYSTVGQTGTLITSYWWIRLSISCRLEMLVRQVPIFYKQDGQFLLV